MFLQLLVNGLVTGSVYAIAAVGISLVYGILRLVNFAYGDMMTFGAFAGFFANATLGLPMIASALFGWWRSPALSVALDVVLWRPLRLRRAGFMSLFLASIGVALVLRQAMLLVWGPQPRAYDVDPFKVYVVGDVRLSLAQVATIVGRRRRHRGDRRCFWPAARWAASCARCPTTASSPSSRGSTSTA